MQKEDTTVINRIKRVIEYLGESYSEFSDRIGVDKSNLSKMLNGQRTIGDAVINKIILSTEFRKEWLKDGIGDPLLSEEEYYENYVKGRPDEEAILRRNAGLLRDKAGAKAVDSAPLVMEVSVRGDKPSKEPPAYTVYLLPMSAMGGPLTGFAADGVTLSNCEKVVSPIDDVDFAITVYGESMAPKYPSGTRVLIKRVNPDIFIDWGKSYVLDTSNGVIVKELRKAKKEGYVACYSINPDPKFEPFDVPLSEVNGVYRVLMSLSAE